MSITVTCPSCRKALKTPDNAAGRKVKCPGCGTSLSIPLPKTATAPFDDLAELAPTTPKRRAKASSRIILFAVGGGGLALLLLAVVVIIVLKSGGSKSSVEVSVNWKTPDGIDADDNPVAVLIPKGMTEKIDVFVPIYAGPEYEKVYGKKFRKCGAYLAVGAGGKAWFDNVEPGSYILIVFPNSFMGVIDEGISKEDAARAQKQLQPFFTDFLPDELRQKPVFVQVLEVRERIVDVRHEFLKRRKPGKGQQP